MPLTPAQQEFAANLKPGDIPLTPEQYRWGQADRARKAAEEAGTQAPATGLIGAERALGGGLQNSLSGLFGTYGQGRTDLQSGTDAARDDLWDINRMGRVALRRERDNAMDQIGMGIGELNQGQGQGLEAIRAAIQAGVDPFQGFVDTGRQSNNLQAALSGALGPEAQAQAMQNYTDSPGQAWLQEQGERAVTRNASAMGGLGGGRVMQELQRQGQGLAALDFQNNFNRLGQVTGTGLQAATGIGNLRGQEAGLSSNLISQLSQARARMRGQGANINQRTGEAILGNREQLASGMAGLNEQLASRMAGLTERVGFGASNAAYQHGTQVAGLRTDAGNRIADSISDTTSGLADLINQQGAGVSDITGNAGGNLATMLTNLSNQTGMSQEQLAGLLGNIAIGESTQVNSQPGVGALVPESNLLGQVGQVAGGIGTLIEATNP